MQVINTTPLEIVILGENNEEIKRFEAAKTPITYTEERFPAPPLEDGTPMSSFSRGQFANVPEYTSYYDYLFIVEKAVKQAFPQRLDMVVAAEPVKDEAGKIIGYRSLSR